MDSKTGVHADTLSSDDGHYALPPLPNGVYEIFYTHANFAQTVLAGLKEDASRTRALNAVLHLVASGESVVVTTASAPNSENAALGTRTGLITESPASQTVEGVSRGEFKDTPAFSIGEVLALVPGVTFLQGSGPRDVTLSVRGSDARQNAFIRNLQVFEDGFPVTQPDGQARTDLTDPHAYRGVDVVEGPNSALYGNYATGGAIDFHTRTGADIHGFQAGTDYGSFQYFNDYATYGASGKNYEGAAFVSNVRSEQATKHYRFNTVTADVLATVSVTPHNRVTFKFIINRLDTDLPIRLSLNQYRLNPYQAGCSAFSSAAAAAGCGSVNLFTNGRNGTRIGQTAAQALLGRHDWRAIVGGRWERDLTGKTVLQAQGSFDERSIHQPQNALLNFGTEPSVSFTGGVLRRGGGGTTYAGGFFNAIGINSFTFNIVGGNGLQRGGQTQSIVGKQSNTGFRVREEKTLTEHWTVVGGLGGEYSAIQVTANNFTYPSGAAAATTVIPANRTFFNLAPELGAQYRPSVALSVHARFGAGYGTPQPGQLFVNEQGLNGNNTQLATQRDYGTDIGADWTPSPAFHATGAFFYEFFRNEQVAQSAGVNLQSFTFNAPASQHRGIEAGFDWTLPHTLPGARLRASYQYDNQIYTDYTETLTSGASSASFNRSGNFIPGVPPNFLNARLIYDRPGGKLAGLGGFVETDWLDNFPLDNANLLAAPGSTLVNLNAHYDAPSGHGVLSRLRLYYELQNAGNRSFIGSSSNITDSLNAAGQESGASVLANATGSIYAGSPRASFGGVRARF